MTVLNFPSDTSQSPYEANGITYVWDGQKWTAYGDGFAGTTVHVGPTPPVGTPNEGDLWWHDEEARLYVYYVDDDSSQWVDASPGGGSGGGGGGSDYVLPPATNSELGGVKVGARLTVSADGTLSADIQGGGGTTVGSLQEVTDVGNTTDNAIVTDSYLQTGAHTADTGLIQLLTGTSDVTKEAIRFIESDTSTRSFIVQSDGTTKLGGNAGSAPNITLNADGSSLFTSNVKCSATTNTFSALNDGYIIVQDPDADSDSIFFRGRTSSDSVQFQVNGDGTTYIGGGPSPATTPANITLTGDGQIKASSTKVVSETIRKVAALIGSTHSIKKAGPTTEVIIQQTQCDGTLYIGGDDTNANIMLAAAGSASFAQDVKIGGVLPDSPNITLQADGDIHVVGQVYSGANAFLGQGTGSRLSADGAIYTSRDNADAPAFTAYVTGDSNPKVLIRSGGTIELGANAASAPTHILNTSGTAYHGGVVTVGAINIAADGVEGCEVRNDGLVRAQRPSNKTGSAVFQGWCGTDLVSPTSTISASGAASFAGNVDAGSGADGGGTAGESGATLNASGLLQAARSDAASEVFQGFISGSGTRTSSITAGGAATFASSVACQGYVDVTRADNSAAFQVNLTGTGATAKITGDGGAEFNSNVTVGPDPINGPYASLRASGAIDLYANADDLFIFTGRKADGTPTSTIRGNGSAEFAGSVAIGGTDAAHTIDEYEEGSWTPTVGMSDGAAGFAFESPANLGRYVKVGQQVTCMVRVKFSSVGTSTGSVIFGGLPFQSITTGGIQLVYTDVSEPTDSRQKTIPGFLSVDSGAITTSTAFSGGGVQPAVNDEIQLCITYRSNS